MSLIKGEITVKGVQFGFVRRRYSNVTFTWLHYRNADNAWVEYTGDPWSSVRIPKADLEKVAVELKRAETGVTS